MPARKIPLNVRKACMMLGLDSSSLTRRGVIDAWKELIAENHPDFRDGDVDLTVKFNTAKDTVIRWLDFSQSMPTKKMPLDVRYACSNLELDFSSLTRQEVINSWKKLIAEKAHSELGDDDAERWAVLLNRSKDRIIRWLDDKT